MPWPLWILLDENNFGDTFSPPIYVILIFLQKSKIHDAMIFLTIIMKLIRVSSFAEFIQGNECQIVWSKSRSTDEGMWFRVIWVLFIVYLITAKF